ncbi:MAG: Xaa-Pro dipeptidase [Idiomarinaceae bacterium HL-53]|nr:MAG: Xaa-Pro dipeptidase [Idiomarinaceae bacterium HL-53]CUS47794.1 Xaa-Pro dipeptidase [Idiomarinaceae bacterium HL-53]
MDFHSLFPEHLRVLKERASRLCEREHIDLLAIHAGQPKRLFLDDMEYPFKANPHFKSWCPLDSLEHSWVLFSPQKVKPTLVVLHSDEFWVEQPALEAALWLSMFHVELISRPDEIDKLLPYDKQRTVYLGEHIEVAQALGFTQFNPEPVISFLNYHRALKTDYELQCIRRANEVAIRGHRAVAEAWQAGASEFECLLAYLQKTEQGENEVPYTHIIGQNEHAAILHYRGKSRKQLAPGFHRSLMIDAGASWHGYAADISRSYAGKDAHDEFAELVVAIDQITQALAQEVRPGMSFGDLHQQAHLQIAQLIFAFGFCQMDPEDIVKNKISQVFMPHGIGHLLGLQVHDVGGQLSDERGTIAPAPESYPTLKTTRLLEPRMVFTIEPGLYFIDVLLNKLQDSANSKYMNWNRIAEFQPYGGIRIEDNIALHRDRNENITRELGLN